MTMLVVAGKLSIATAQIERSHLTLAAHSDDNVFDEDEVTEFYEPEVPEEGDGDEVENGDEDNIVVSGDPSAAANAQRDQLSVKDKKIPDSERNTTPYMTKYERARILGTRALQIRYGP